MPVRRTSRSVHLSTHPSTHPLTDPSIRLSIHSSIHPITHSTDPSIHPRIIYPPTHPSPSVHRARRSSEARGPSCGTSSVRQQLPSLPLSGVQLRTGNEMQMELECQDTPYVPLDSLSLPARPHPCRRGFQQEGPTQEGAEDGKSVLGWQLLCPLRMGPHRCHLEVGTHPLSHSSGSS